MRKYVDHGTRTRLGQVQMWRLLCIFEDIYYALDGVVVRASHSTACEWSGTDEDTSKEMQTNC